VMKEFFCHLSSPQTTTQVNSRRLLTGRGHCAPGGRWSSALVWKKQGELRSAPSEQGDYVSDRWSRRKNLRFFNEINSPRNLWSIPSEYEVAVAMKYAAHMYLEFILLHIAVKTAILHNSQNYFIPALQVLHFLLIIFGGLFFFTTFYPKIHTLINRTKVIVCFMG